MMGGTPWTEEEDEIIIEMAKEGKTLMQIYKSGRIKKTYEAIGKRKGKLGYNKSVPDRKSIYSDEEIWKIWILNRKGFSRKEIAKILNRPPGGITYQMTHHTLVYETPRLPCPEHLKHIVKELGGVI